MQQLWTGAGPANRAPSIAPLRIDGRTALDSVTLAPGAAHTATVDARDADGDPLTYRWVVREESTATTIGGDPESLPAAVELRIADTGTAGTLRFTAAVAPGHYRLFVEVHDGQGHAAYANLPFRVAGDAQD